MFKATKMKAASLVKKGEREFASGMKVLRSRPSIRMAFLACKERRRQYVSVYEKNNLSDPNQRGIYPGEQRKLRKHGEELS